MPMLVSAGSARTQATSPTASAASSAGTSLKGDDDGGERGIDLRADGAVTGDDPPAVVEGGQRLVDGAVVAPVEDEHLGPPGDVAGEAQHEAVGVGGRHRQLPERQAEPPVELGGHPQRVGSGEHRGHAPTGLARRWPRPPGAASGRSWRPCRPGRSRRRCVPSTSVQRAPSACSTKIGKAPGQRVIQGIGTPLSRWHRASAARAADAGWLSTKRWSSAARSSASRSRSMPTTGPFWPVAPVRSQPVRSSGRRPQNRMRLNV